jgi:hypothetical protein
MRQVLTGTKKSMINDTSILVQESNFIHIFIAYSKYINNTIKLKHYRSNLKESNNHGTSNTSSHLKPANKTAGGSNLQGASRSA